MHLLLHSTSSVFHARILTWPRYWRLDAIITRHLPYLFLKSQMSKTLDSKTPNAAPKVPGHAQNALDSIPVDKTVPHTRNPSVPIVPHPGAVLESSLPTTRVFVCRPKRSHGCSLTCRPCPGRRYVSFVFVSVIDAEYISQSSRDVASNVAKKPGQRVL